MSGMISIWRTRRQARPFEDAIQASVSRMAGYLVTESEPIVNTKHLAVDGQRTPACIR